MINVQIAVVICSYLVVLFWMLLSLPWPFVFSFAMIPLMARIFFSPTGGLLLPFVALNSGLLIPGFAGRFELYQLFMLLYLLRHLASTALVQRPLWRSGQSGQRWVMALMAWIVFLMVLRGTGMRILGSPLHGGAIYIQSLTVLAFYIVCSGMSIPTEDLRRAGILMGLLSVLPMLANAVFVFSGGRIWQQMMFFRAGGSASIDAFNVYEGVRTRFSFLAMGSTLVWVGVFLPVSPVKDRIRRYAWWLLAAGATFMAGYRSAAISLLGFFGLYGFLISKQKKVYSALIATAGALGYGCLFFFSHLLPFPVQRILSGIPGIQADWQARVHALSTMDWRRNLWELALTDLPRYWLVGRGVTFNAADLLSPRVRVSAVYASYITGSFHQATLEILILYGFPALLACLCFYGASLMGGYADLRNRHPFGTDTRMERWAQALLAYVTVRALLAFAGGQSMELLAELPAYLAFYTLLRNRAREEDHR